MSFDRTKPVPSAEIDANELRTQFNGLHDGITAIPTGNPRPARQRRRNRSE